LSDDFTRCYGSVKECARYIPHTGFHYAWIDELYSNYLKALKERANCNHFEIFYMELVQLQKEGKLELASAEGDIRERLARQRGFKELNNLMENCFKEMLKQGKISKVNWLYQRI